jgi:hypothetical protein
MGPGDPAAAAQQLPVKQLPAAVFILIIHVRDASINIFLLKRSTCAVIPP